ncbi:hypothetical protein HpBGD77_06020 [Helicobacter pylori]
MIIRTIEEPFDLILEERVMLSERVKMLFVFLFFSFGCLSVNFLEHLNKPHFCGFVAGAFYKEGLGDIDLVWGNKDYGLEHILKRREKQAKNKGLNEQQAKEYALNIAKTIPEAIDKGVKVDNNGRMAIEYKNIRVGLNNDWNGKKLPNKWVISSYEIYNSESEPPSLLMAQLQEVGLGTPKLTEPNPNTKN